MPTRTPFGRLESQDLIHRNRDEPVFTMDDIVQMLSDDTEVSAAEEELNRAVDRRLSQHSVNYEEDDDYPFNLSLEEFEEMIRGDVVLQQPPPPPPPRPKRKRAKTLSEQKKKVLRHMR